MADNDWESVTRIGSKARSGGAGERQTVIKGKSALNAAYRAGAIVATEKKFGGANTVRLTFFGGGSAHLHPPTTAPIARLLNNY